MPLKIYLYRSEIFHLPQFLYRSVYVAANYAFLHRFSVWNHIQLYFYKNSP